MALLAFLLAAGCQRPEVADPDPWTPIPGPEKTPVAVRTAEERPTPPVRPGQAADPFSKGTPTPEAAAPLKAQGAVSNPVFSTDEAGAQPTQEFAADTDEIFLSFDLDVPRKAGTLKSVWTAGQHKSVDSQALKAGRQHLVVSSLRPPAGWPVGTGQVELQMGNKPVATYEFAVTEASTPLPLAPPAPPSDARVPSIVLTDEEEGSELKQVFPPGSARLFLKIENGQLPRGIPVDAVWKTVQVRGLPPGQIVKQSRSPAPGNADEILQFAAIAPGSGGLLPGDYTVDVAVGRETIWTCPFRVK